MIEQHYDVKRAAELLGVSEKTVYRRVWNGELAYRRVGKLIRIPESALKRLLESAALPA